MLSEKIISYRAKNKLNQEQFAKKCNLSKLTILNAEKNKKIGKISIKKIEIVLEEQ